MSTVISKNVQVGTSGTAAQNFTLYQPATPDGTVRLGVGNSGATTGDVVTVNSAGVTVTGTLTATTLSGSLGAATATSLAVSGASTTGSLAVNGNNISAVNSLGFRNRIFNGGMVIDQRNNGASVTGNGGVFPVDRWQTYATQSSKLTCQRSTTAPTGFVNSVIYTSSSAYSVLAGDYFSTAQRIEGFNVADLMYGTASAVTTTLSFWVRSSLTGTFGGACHNNAFNRVYPFSYTISAANTWEFKTVQIVGDTTGTWTTDNSVGLEIGFSLGCGSSGLGTAGAWAGTSNIFGATGQVNLVGTNGATWYITGVQLEAGSVATPFERVDYGRQLLMCQRYCEAIVATGSGGDKDIGVGGGNGNAGNFQAFVAWKVQKRAAPTLTLAAASNFYAHAPGAFRVTCTSVSPIDPTEFGSHFSGVSSSGSFSVGQMCFLAAIPSTPVIIASAEL